MKKIFSFLAVALFAVGAVSCSKMDVSVALPGEGNVEFTINTPGELTRATIGNGENVNIVYYEIYKADRNHKNSVIDGTPLLEGTIKDFPKNNTLSLNMLEDQEYVALFWAQVDQPQGKEFYDVTDLRYVAAYYTTGEGKDILANNEDRAAFCQVHPFSTTDKGYNKSQTVELVRPFAQLNLGTDKAFLNKDYKITLEESKMVVKSVGKAFNVAKMKSAAEKMDVVFDFGKVPAEDLEVNKTLYAYAGMNYFFVPSDEASVNVVYDIKTDVGTVNRTVSNVPVKTNFRTNILGNLLTQETVLTIVVDESFNVDENFEGNEVVDGEK